ncbi:agarase, partial [Candidatus Latescibacterota bacterium]
MLSGYPRREFIRLGSAAAFLLTAVNSGFAQTKIRTTQTEPEGYFTVGRRNGRWWFITPQGSPFFSIGLNHIDSATLRYQDNHTIWDEKYHNDMKSWLSGTVRKDLLSWGFNTVGWNQEYVMEGRHSRNFTPEEYKWLDMPYGHMLRFSETHQWETETRHPDIMSESFADWCDYVARDDCGRLKNDPNLIGYYFTDCPMWVHTRERNEWKGPMFDPDKLKSVSGKKELSGLADRYYQVIHD